MFTEQDFCSFGTSSFLKDAGYVDPTRYSYIKHTRVSDEIMEKHPGLSDDGYMDLLLIKELPYSAVPGALTKFLKGKIKEVDKYVEYCRCKKLTLHAEPALPINIDGELTDGMLPITIEVKHRCLQVCK